MSIALETRPSPAVIRIFHAAGQIPISRENIITKEGASSHATGRINMLNPLRENGVRRSMRIARRGRNLKRGENPRTKAATKVRKGDLRTWQTLIKKMAGRVNRRAMCRAATGKSEVF